MSTPTTEDGWSAPTIHTTRRAAEPRTFTELDPIGSVMVPRDPDAGDEVWGSVTLVGRPRRRGKDGEARAAGAGVAPAAGTTDTAVAPEVVGGEIQVGTPTDGAPETSAETDHERSTRGVLAASGSMAVASLVSRVTGFLRTVVIVAALGTGGVADAYNTGNTLPNMIYELLLGGVLSSVLIPLLVRAQDEDEDGGVAYTQRLLSLAAAALAVMTMLAVLAAPLFAAAFTSHGSQRELTSVFATLLLPEIFFYGLGAMFTAVLNIRGSYRAGAWSPVLNNVVMIVTVAVFWILPGPSRLDPATITTTQILVLGIGTTLGIAAQALVLVPALRSVDFHWHWRFRATPGDHGRLRELGVLGGWVLAYVLVSQVGVSVITRVGNHNGGFTVFTNADLLFQMPYGILVVSLLTAIMPRLSRAALRQDDEAVRDDLALGARLSAVALIPVTAGLIVLGPVLGITLFAHGETSISGGRLIGSALAWSAFGLFPFAVVMLQLRVFYAMRDGRTPTLINVFMVVTKTVLVLVTSALYAAPAGTNVHTHPSSRAIEWLNISTSASYVVGAVVGHVVLTRRLGRLGFGSVAQTALRIAVASAIGAAAAYGVVVLARDALGGAHLGAGVGLAGGAVAGLAVMAVVAWRLRIPALQQALASVRGR